jgi:hypothetical protein
LYLRCLFPCLEKIKIKAVSMRTPHTLLQMCVLLLQVAFLAACGSTLITPYAFSSLPAASSVAVGRTVTLQAAIMTSGNHAERFRPNNLDSFQSFCCHCSEQLSPKQGGRHMSL